MYISIKVYFILEIRIFNYKKQCLNEKTYVK